MGISFIVASAILGFGVGVGDLPKCKAAIILCLVFYVGGKVIMYVFLVERVHSIQQHQRTRREDPLFLGSLVVVLLGFGIIAIFSFVEPLYDISQIDGRCRIGLPLKITLPLLIYDIAANLSLTVIFFHLVRPYMRRGLPNFTPQWLKEWGATIQSIIGKRPVNPGPETNALDNRGLVERLAWKSLVAGVGVLCSTVANLSLLFYLRGFEQSWLCFMLCTIDITWGVLVVHWVTHDPTELEHRPLQRSYVDDRWPSSGPASPGPNKPIPLRINVAHTTTIESGLPDPDDKYIGSPSLFNSPGYSGHRSQGYRN
ncbi:MAG: hypothetical protein M1824_006204 [Vezdaea acicularis]|nr:MAG: hypothetical protein M1824_006204 [Vezdaea acicularis]